MNDVSEAAERVRSGSHSDAGDAFKDMAVVCEAYLAEHDETPITEEWLRSVGASCPFPHLLELRNDYGVRLSVHRDMGAIYVNGFRVRCLESRYTRGEIRQLSRLIAIPLEQSK